MPPKRKPTRATRRPISDELLQALNFAGRTLNAVAAEAGVDRSALARFVSGERDLMLATLDRLAPALGLKLIRGPRKPPAGTKRVHEIDEADDSGVA